MAAYDALLAAVRQHGKFAGYTEKEKPQDFLRRLAAATADLPLQAFEALAPEAQTWFDQAADALQAGYAVPVPEPFNPEDYRPAEAVSSGRVVRPSASGAAARHVAPPAQRPAAPVTTLDPSEPLSTSVSRLMIADPTLAIDAVLQQLHSVGVHPQRGSVATLRNQALIFLRIIREEGWQPPHR